MQLVQTKCDIIDRFKEGDLVKVSFNIKGNKWERDGKINYFTNLDACKLEKVSASGRDQNVPSRTTLEDIPPENDELSDLPF